MIPTLQLGQTGRTVPQPSSGTVKSLLHFDQADGTTIPVDEVPGVTWSNDNTNRAVIRTAQSKFGTASLARPSAGSIAGGIYCDFAGMSWPSTQAFTIEYFIRATNFAAAYFYNNNHFAVYSGTRAYALDFSDSDQKLRLKKEGNAAYAGPGTTVLSANTWYHVALTSDGTTGRVFLNGNLEFTFTPRAIVVTPPATVTLSPGRNKESNGDYYDGYLDEFRWVHGACLYSSNFTPPAAPFSYP